MDAATPALSLLLRRIAGHRDTAARLSAEIDATEGRMRRLLAQRVPGALIDAIEDTVFDLRARLMANDVALMTLVAESRRINDRRPERRRVDLEQAFRAMP